MDRRILAKWESSLTAVWLKRDAPIIDKLFIGQSGIVSYTKFLDIHLG